MTTQAIDTEFQDGKFSIYFNRPEARNPLNKEVRFALTDAIQNPPEGTRVMFLRGRGGVFCAGQDLKEFMANMGNKDHDPKQILKEEYEPILSAIDEATVPVIAVVEGSCVGAGMSLALACDYIIASDTAYFQLSFAKIALSPDVGASFLLPKIIGRNNDMDMQSQLDLEGKFQAECIHSADFKEAVMAFFQKREPKFTGE